MTASIPFKFPTLNQYVTIERGELVIFAAEAKQGKSMMLLNCAIDLLKQDKAVLYLDSELNTRLFTARVLAHLTGIEYRRLTSGAYTPAEAEKIDQAIQWMKTRKFTHIYIPMFDVQSVYTTVKKVSHTQGLDVLIVDYFKSSADGDAWDSYAELGRFVDEQDHVHMKPTELLGHPESCSDYNIRMKTPRCESLKTEQIGQSAAKSRTGKRSTTIQYGVGRKHVRSSGHRKMMI